MTAQNKPKAKASPKDKGPADIFSFDHGFGKFDTY